MYFNVTELMYAIKQINANKINIPFIIIGSEQQVKKDTQRMFLEKNIKIIKCKYFHYNWVILIISSIGSKCI